MQRMHPVLFILKKNSSIYFLCTEHFRSGSLSGIFKRRLLFWLKRDRPCIAQELGNVAQNYTKYCIFWKNYN